MTASGAIDVEIEADIRFRLALALEAQGSPRQQVLALTRQARARLGAAPERYREELEEMDHWLTHLESP